MQNLPQHIQRAHYFFARQALYPVLLSTLLAFSLYLGRVFYTRELTFLFLVWNLFLAWIPYTASLAAARMHQSNPRRWHYLLLPGMLWLAFFPNAPYIVTDFLHLDSRPPTPIWYDIGLITVFAWTGLFLAVYSLRSMQLIVKTYIGNILSWGFVLGVLGLSGLGVYMGRFLRWNSWDLLTHPNEIVSDVTIRLLNPFSHPGAYGVTLLFATFLFICYLTLTTIPTAKEYQAVVEEN